MLIAKWGNSLAVRLPKQLVDELGLKEGDEVQVTPSGEKSLTISRDTKRVEALKRLTETKWTIPAGYKFDREEAHERGYMLDDPKPFKRK